MARGLEGIVILHAIWERAFISHAPESKSIIDGRPRSFCPRPFHFWWWPGVGRWRSETCLAAGLRMVYVDIVPWNRLSLRMPVFNGRLSFCKLGGGDVPGARLTRHVRAQAASVRA